MNFAKFLRTPFFTKHLRWLLLTQYYLPLRQDEMAKIFQREHMTRAMQDIYIYHPLKETNLVAVRTYDKGIARYTDITSLMKHTLTRSTSASTRRARRSDATTFEQSKRIFLRTLPRTGFNTEAVVTLAFHS